MTPRLVRILASAALGFGLLGLAVFGVDSCSRNKSAKQELNASESKGKSDEHAQAGAGEVAQAKAASVQDTSAKAEVERLKGELAALKSKVQSRPALPGIPSVPEPAVVVGSEPGVDGGLSDLQAVVAKQDEVIKAQDARIVSLETLASHWEKAAGEYQAAFKNERDRALSLELALEAQKSASKSSLWRGRIGGVAVGFGVGFIAGRLR